MNIIAKFLIFTGLIITFLGILLFFVSNFKIPFIGKLPGDILIEKKNFTFYFPITTSILISIVLSFIFYILSRFFK